MSHYSESIFFQSRCAATQINRSRLPASVAPRGTGGANPGERKGQGENPPLPIRNPKCQQSWIAFVVRRHLHHFVLNVFLHLLSGGLASHVSKFIKMPTTNSKIQDPCSPANPGGQPGKPGNQANIDALNHWSMNINNQNLSHLDKSHIEQWCCINDRVVCYVLFRSKVIVGQPKT